MLWSQSVKKMKKKNFASLTVILVIFMIYTVTSYTDSSFKSIVLNRNPSPSPFRNRRLFHLNISLLINQYSRSLAQLNLLIHTGNEITHRTPF